MKELDSKAAFKIQIQFTRNATWQGEIVWVNKNKKCTFRSELEMLKLMQEAINDSESRDASENDSLVAW